MFRLWTLTQLFCNCKTEYECWTVGQIHKAEKKQKFTCNKLLNLNKTYLKEWFCMGFPESVSFLIYVAIFLQLRDNAWVLSSWYTQKAQTKHNLKRAVKMLRSGLSWDIVQYSETSTACEVRWIIQFLMHRMCQKLKLAIKLMKCVVNRKWVVQWYGDQFESFMDWSV